MNTGHWCHHRKAAALGRHEGPVTASDAVGPRALDNAHTPRLAERVPRLLWGNRPSEWQ